MLKTFYQPLIEDLVFYQSIYESQDFHEQANATLQEGMPTTSHPLTKQHQPGTRMRRFYSNTTSNQGGERQEGINLPGG